MIIQDKKKIIFKQNNNQTDQKCFVDDCKFLNIPCSPNSQQLNLMYDTQKSIKVQKQIHLTNKKKRKTQINSSFNNLTEQQQSNAIQTDDRNIRFSNLEGSNKEIINYSCQLTKNVIPISQYKPQSSSANNQSNFILIKQQQEKSFLKKITFSFQNNQEKLINHNLNPFSNSCKQQNKDLKLGGQKIQKKQTRNSMIVDRNNRLENFLPSSNNIIQSKGFFSSNPTEEHITYLTEQKQIQVIRPLIVYPTQNYSTKEFNPSQLHRPYIKVNNQKIDITSYSNRYKSYMSSELKLTNPSPSTNQAHSFKHNQNQKLFQRIINNIQLHNQKVDIYLHKQKVDIQSHKQKVDIYYQSYAPSFFVTQQQEKQQSQFTINLKENVYQSNQSSQLQQNQDQDITTFKIQIRELARQFHSLLFDQINLQKQNSQLCDTYEKHLTSKIAELTLLKSRAIKRADEIYFLKNNITKISHQG